jgi:hypothetical protein
MSFQTQVNLTPAPAQAGDFASSNPRVSVLAGEGGLIAGSGGVIVGNFAWNNNGVVQSYGTAPNAPDGIVHREMQALIQTYLAESGNNIPQGFPVNLFNEGDFWVKNNSASATTMNEAVYARYSDGAVFFGSAPTGATVTGSIGATFTASAGTPTTQLVVTAVTGLISIGDTVSGTGITAGTTIVSQASGTTGGAGTYNLSAANTCSAATVTSFGNVLNVTAVSSGTLAIGDPVTGTGIPASANISGIITGTNGIGVYTLDVAATAYAASTTVTAVGGVVTSWKAKSVANAGELVKISTWG